MYFEKHSANQFFLPSVQFDTRQTICRVRDKKHSANSCLPTHRCRVLYAVCYTRQSSCRVPLALGKSTVSRSERGLAFLNFILSQVCDSLKNAVYTKLANFATIVLRYHLYLSNCIFSSLKVKRINFYTKFANFTTIVPYSCQATFLAP